MDAKIKQEVLGELLKSKDIKKLYDNYIIKDIPFETWVTSTFENIIDKGEVQIQA